MSFAQSFVNGYGLGLQGQRVKRANELADIQIEEAREKRADNALLDEADSSAFGGSQPAAPIVERGTGGTAPPPGAANAQGLQPGQPSGAPTQAPDFLGQYNTALNNYMSMAANPKYKSVSREIMGRIDDLNKQAEQVNGFMHRQAVQAAFPHIKTLHDPAASDEAKSAAATELATKAYPDGKNYRMVVKGGTVTMLDDNGQPRMQGDKPMETTLESLIDSATSALDSPESFLQTRREALKERRAEARADKVIEKTQTFTAEQNDLTRAQAREMDASRTARDDKRIAASSEAANMKDFAANVARDMGEWSKDERARITADPAYKTDPNARQQAYDAAVRRYAPIYGLDPGRAGVSAAPGRVTPGAGEAIDVEVGGGGAGIPAPPSASTAPATAPAVPTPNSSTQGAGLTPFTGAGGMAPSAQDESLASAGRAVVDSVAGIPKRIGTAIDNQKAAAATSAIKELRANGNRPIQAGSKLAESLSWLAQQDPDALLAAGATKEEVEAYRRMAPNPGRPQ